MSVTARGADRAREGRLVLVNPSRLYSDGWSTDAEAGRNNPAFEILRGAVQGAVNVEVLDLPTQVGVPESDAQREKFLALTCALIDGTDWDGALVGISCWSSLHYLATLEVARMIKRRSPGTRIVVGGYHPTAVPGDFLEFPDLFDHVVQGAGERVLKGILTGRIKQRLVHAPATRGAPRELLHQRPPERPTAVHYVYLSRGCPFECSYCMESTMSLRQWRALGPRQAADLVVAIDRTGHAGRIAICDPCFGANPKWRHAFLRRLVDRGITTQVWAETRPDTFQEEDFQLLQQLPFQVDFGIDSASETMLRIMRKTNNPRRYLDRTADVCRQLDARGVRFCLYLIFNHPGETDYTIHETVEYLSALRSSLRNNHGHFVAGTYFYVPGTAVETELAQLAEDHGTVVHEPAWWKQRSPHHPLATRVDATTGRPGSEIHGDHWWRAMERLNRPLGAWRFLR
ncbi:MAG: cobalamin B12-binding domain-containing protein [Deltaproteobacteria bacterium]|nr:cobalamin B12-binding domain-containing protein [Deltaproteobacteria bacterium]